MIKCVRRRGGGDAKEIHGSGMKKAVSRKKGSHEVMCRNSTEENKRRHKGTKNE